ncbi:hypothetical protein BGC07_18420 [Piscirickettsia litoralis]|uniref:Uncharacterized protein n=2 Tax=Piscirickettsia litoralis TaxID=1891921 RepID=A0ABX2ZWL2_9GAMM|nr:hypothetical protein BGC07_18420 [Piscirickettsia litoralis]
MPDIHYWVLGLLILFFVYFWFRFDLAFNKYEEPHYKKSIASAMINIILNKKKIKHYGDILKSNEIIEPLKKEASTQKVTPEEYFNKPQTRPWFFPAINQLRWLPIGTFLKVDVQAEKKTDSHAIGPFLNAPEYKYWLFYKSSYGPGNDITSIVGNTHLMLFKSRLKRLQCIFILKFTLFFRDDHILDYKMPKWLSIFTLVLVINHLIPAIFNIHLPLSKQIELISFMIFFVLCFYFARRN